MLLCRVCGREIAKGTVFVTKHVRAGGQEYWLPVHCLCNAALAAGKQRIDGRALSTPPGKPVGDSLMLPVSNR